MTKEQRAKASVDQTLAYLDRYYVNWRLVKILSVKKILNDKYNFYFDLKNNFKTRDDNDGDATIAQEITNGLYFDAISQCVQYIEDLFALVKASKQPDFFIRNVISYKAGEVTNLIRSYNPKHKLLAEDFHFPYKIPGEQSVVNLYHEGLSIFITLIMDIVQFYKQYEFFNNQYKHGLAVAHRSFGNIFPNELLAEDKLSGVKPFIAVYDNMNLNIATSKGRASVKQGIFLPVFTNNVRIVISSLEKENNFLRFVQPDHAKFSFELIEEIARKVSYCMNIFIFNYTHKINPIDKQNKFQLPIDYNKNTANIFTYSI